MDTEPSRPLAAEQNEIGDTAVVSDGGPTGRERTELEVTLVPDELQATLQPRSEATEPERLHSLWHRVKPPQGMQITLRAPADRHRVLSLTTRSRDPHWQPHRVRWAFAARVVSELEGGDGVTAKDRLLPGGGELQMVLLPGETRIAYLESCAELDEETAAHDYEFDILISEVQGEEAVVVRRLATCLQLRHPASRLLDYLPAIYQKMREEVLDADTRSNDRSFFERFLLGFEDAMQPMQAMLGSMERFFGADTAPPDFLPWLATWVGLVLDENWPEMRRRRLIKEAVELYRWRGTKRGLSRYLEIYAGVSPEITDKPFVGMRLGAATKLGRKRETDGTLPDGNTVLGGVATHCFVVTLAVPDVRLVNEKIVRDIIVSEKPAHAAYALNIVMRG